MRYGRAGNRPPHHTVTLRFRGNNEIGRHRPQPPSVELEVRDGMTSPSRL
jgi:hypothetical protein